MVNIYIIEKMSCRVFITRLPNEKLDNVANWANENEYGSKISYYDDKNNPQDIKISGINGYRTYVINTNFGRARELNDFRFAVEK